MNTFTIESAIQLLRADVQDDRDAVRAAAEFLVDHQAELSGRAVALLTAEEVEDPRWRKVVENTTCLCDCPKPACTGRMVRIFGTPLRSDIGANEGTLLRVTRGQTVYLGLKGGTEPVVRFFVSPREHGVLSRVEIDRLDGSPLVLPLLLANKLLEGAPANVRCLKTLKTPDHLPQVVARVEGACEDGLLLFVDNGVEQISVREQFKVGTRLVVGKEKVYIRRKGAPDNAAVKAYWVNADAGQLRFEDEPLSREAWLRQLKGQGLAYNLTDLAEQVVPLPDDERVSKAKVGAPQPMVRIEAVDATTVTMTLDDDFEVYTPAPESRLPEFSPETLAMVQEMDERGELPDDLA